MKKSLAKKITLCILAGAVLMSSSVVWAKPKPPGDSSSMVEKWERLYAGEFLRNELKNPNGQDLDYVKEYYSYEENIDEEFEEACFYGSILPNSDSEEASGGKVTLDEDDVTVYSIIGGYARYDNEVTLVLKNNGVAESNTVTISNGEVVYSAIGGRGYTASSNTVNISGGKIGSDASPVLVVGGFAEGGNANSNTVNISGGTFTGEVCGGYSTIIGVANNNTVNISGVAILENAGLFGGAKVSKGSSEGVYGGADAPNTLNIGVDDELKSQLATKGITVDVGAWNNKKVKSIAGFDTINFKHIVWNDGGTVINADDLHLDNTKITAYIAEGTLSNDEEKMNLIATKNNIVGNIATSGNVVNVGIAATYTGAIAQEEKAIVVTLTGDTPGGGTSDSTGDGTGGEDGGTPGGGTGDSTGDGTGGGNTGDDNTGSTIPGGTPIPERNDQVLVLGESRAAAVAFTNQGSELIELGLNALTRDNSKDTKVFAAVYGNHSEYETGSHVNVNGWSGIVGIGKTNANGLTVGAFFENGEGNYSTHNIFTDDYIRGDGEACYNGGGLLVRKDNANGVYAEASLRAGNLQNELRNAVRNGQDLTGYDVDTFYYGAHIGIGKVIPRGADGDSLDVYGKFIYTHHDGETFDIGGTATKFDSVESERLRLGFRINEVQTNKLSMYYGAVWEYEFNGDAHDKIASFDLETPSLEGSTVIGEVGAHYKASEKWSLDLSARAYTGQREGFSGSVQANYSF
ncbi:MAG: autotransporter outer membrane beta-barrel domain-containing protein [Phascolarctobacterium sp.]|nr:autotransporter outer membrane beta-barrel domain-containing protein [Phascolarctobacterium sp.]